MKTLFKKISIVIMFFASSVLAYTSFLANRNTGELGGILGPSIAEGASCGTSIVCNNGSGTASGSSSGSSIC